MYRRNFNVKSLGKNVAHMVKIIKYKYVSRTLSFLLNKKTPDYSWLGSLGFYCKTLENVCNQKKIYNIPGTKEAFIWKVRFV